MTSRLLFVLAALFTLPVSAAEKREEIVEYTLDFAPGKMLSVHARNGGITLKTWARDQVFVRAIKKAEASSGEEAEEMLETTAIEIKERDSGIEIRTQHPDNKWKIFKNWNISVNYTVTVPQSVSPEPRGRQRKYLCPLNHGQCEKRNRERKYQNQWYERRYRCRNRERQHRNRNCRANTGQHSCRNCKRRVETISSFRLSRPYSGRKHDRPY